MIFSEYLQKFPFLCREKNTHKHRLPPGGSWRRRRLKESARLAFSFFFRFDENLQAVFSLNLNLSPKVRNNKIKSEIHGQTKQKVSADFSFRWLLPSRLRVPPSSRRKATVDALHCNKKQKCRLSVLKTRILHLFSLQYTGCKSKRNAPHRASLREGSPVGRVLLHVARRISTEAPPA